MKLMTINLNLDGNGTVFYSNATVKAQLKGKNYEMVRKDITKQK